MQVFKKYLLPLLSAVTMAASAQNSCLKNLQGQTILWIVAVCEGRAETDDFEAPKVRSCVDQLIKKYKALDIDQDCKINAVLRKEWCAFGTNKKSYITQCFQSDALFPRVLSDGGVGN